MGQRSVLNSFVVLFPLIWCKRYMAWGINFLETHRQFLKCLTTTGHSHSSKTSIYLSPFIFSSIAFNVATTKKVMLPQKHYRRTTCCFPITTNTKALRSQSIVYFSPNINFINISKEIFFLSLNIIENQWLATSTVIFVWKRFLLSRFIWELFASFEITQR